MRSSVEMVEQPVHSPDVSALRQLPDSYVPAMGMPASTSCAAASRLSDLAVSFFAVPLSKR